MPRLSMINEKNAAMLDERHGRWYNLNMEACKGAWGFRVFGCAQKAKYRGAEEARPKGIDLK